MSPPGEGERRPVVLAVDDSADMLALISDVLEGAGMTTLVARSGEAALTLIGRVEPDLILMDAVMPGMDGFETCRRVKQNPACAHLPVVFMTGLSDTEHVVLGFRSGGADYVTKPIQPEELVARLLGHLASARMARSARVALDVAGTPLVAIDAQAQVLWMTPASLRLLEHTPGSGNTASPAWARHVRPVLAEVLAQKLGKTLLHEGRTGTLTAAFAGETGPGEYLVRLSLDRAAGDDAVLRRRFDLTGREAEVLYWLAQGKSNRDIAEILTCSPRTVNKHLEQVYAKLAVDNRTAAAMLAVRVLMEQ